MNVVSPKEYQRLVQKQQKKRKYRNHIVEVDGIQFDSQLEANYYSELRLRKKAKDIKDFKLQPTYVLQEAFEKDGKKHRAITYVADFEIIHLDGSIEVVDTKGVRTAVFNLKEKMFLKRYPHKLSVINA